MGRGIRRAADGGAGEIEVADVVAPEINDKAVTAGQLALIKRFGRADRLRSPAKDGLWIGVGVDNRLRRVSPAAERRPERLGGA